MPISEIDGCPADHWSEILEIFTEAIEPANFEVRLVSASDDIGVIQKRIVQNLYQNDIIVCDVSAKNANVMFELGMRLAFDKPTIIVKDDKTSYSFDTSPIEHLEYPRDLRFGAIVEFKKNLERRVKATYEKSTSDKEYSTFLKQFGTFSLPKIDAKEVSGDEYIIEEIRELKRSIGALARRRMRDVDDPESSMETANFVLDLRREIENYRFRKKIPMSELKNHRDDIWKEMIEVLNPARIHSKMSYDRTFNVVFESLTVG